MEVSTAIATVAMVMLIMRITMDMPIATTMVTVMGTMAKRRTKV